MSDFEMRNVCKSFPGVKALDNANFHADRGDIVALLGENGAGKSTLIKTSVVNISQTPEKYISRVKN